MNDAVPSSTWKRVNFPKLPEQPEIIVRRTTIVIVIISFFIFFSFLALKSMKSVSWI